MSHAPNVSEFDLPRLWQSGLMAEIDWHAELPSTNSRALDLAACEELPLPHLVLCDRQTAGRGRGANRWWSAEGALTFSLIVGGDDLRTRPGELPRLSLAAGLGVCEAIRETSPGLDPRLKWPNDVYLAGRKLCGILVELAPAHGRAVIGIGINLNNSFDSAPADVRAGAISLRDVDGQARDPNEALLAVVRNVLRESGEAATAGSDLSDRWQSVCLLTGRVIQVDAGTQRVTGRCAGIAPDGALVLLTETGPRRIVSGVVQHFE